VKHRAVKVYGQAERVPRDADDDPGTVDGSSSGLNLKATFTM